MEGPEPGSADADRMAAFVAKAKAGLVPTVRVGLPPKVDVSKGAKMPNFVATSIIPQPKIAGAMQAFQQ
jgi:hypothetical protein